LKKVRYAMWGFGGIAENRLAREGFGRDPQGPGPMAEAELVGVTDLNPARRGAAESLGLRWYADGESLLADNEIDAVVVATNNTTHAPLARAALERGRHVFVEKPMATQSADAEALRRLAVERGLSLAVDHMMTETRANQVAREAVARGLIGRVNDAVLHMEFLHGATEAEGAGWRCSDRSELGGPVGDVASHCLYMAEFLLGDDIEALACVYLPGRLRIAVENAAHIRFLTAGGSEGTLRVSFCDPRGSTASTLANLGYELYGDAGVLRGYATLFQLSGLPGEPVPVRLELERDGRREDLPVDGAANIYQQALRRHARSILEGRPMDGADGLRNLRLIESCHASARENGVWIHNLRDL
jgi:predicted dehydrogenase